MIYNKNHTSFISSASFHRLTGRHPRFFLENSAKISRLGKAQSFGGLSHGLALKGEILLGSFHFSAELEAHGRYA